MHFENYITIIIIINYSSALSLRNNWTGKMYLFFVHSDAASNATDKNIFILSLEVCKINMYVNVFGNTIQTPRSAKRFPQVPFDCPPPPPSSSSSSPSQPMTFELFSSSTEDK